MQEAEKAIQCLNGKLALSKKLVVRWAHAQVKVSSVLRITIAFNLQNWETLMLRNHFYWGCLSVARWFQFVLREITPLETAITIYPFFCLPKLCWLSCEQYEPFNLMFSVREFPIRAVWTGHFCKCPSFNFSQTQWVPEILNPSFCGFAPFLERRYVEIPNYQVLCCFVLLLKALTWQQL